MWSGNKFALCTLFVGILAAYVLASPRSCLSNESTAHDMLLGLIRPHEHPSSKNHEPGAIDRLLSVPFARLKRQSHALELTASRDSKESVLNHQSLDWTERTLPGAIYHSLSLKSYPFEDVRPVLATASHKAAGYLSSNNRLVWAGNIAGNISDAYSGFHIVISLKNHSLDLFADLNGRPRKLYSAKVGIGSHEYKTPTGKFFITKIYDDDPWWIPPNEPWAYGEIPSRTVYGGHMMPLMLKRPLRRSNSTEFVPDIIAPKMRIVDWAGIRVHGTNAPSSVGHNRSHGCIRMKNNEVKELADTLKLFVGCTQRGESPNGTYIKLAKPVRVELRDSAY